MKMNRCLIYDCFWDPGVLRHVSVALFSVLVVCRCCFSADWFFSSGVSKARCQQVLWRSFYLDSVICL